MEEKKVFKDTLNLPKSEFPIIYNHKEKDSELVNFWQEQEVFYKELDYRAEKNKNKKVFKMAWGPPYANGAPHMGHAFTKTLKDICAKSRAKMGQSLYFKVGWDCHGLPIEIKALANLNITKQQALESVVQIKQECRKFANHWIEVQKHGFKSLGVLADFDKTPYTTMNYHTQGAEVELFGDCVEKGFITRGEKVTPWCGSCGTVLAIAEIEYKDRKDPSIYVLYQLTDNSVKSLLTKLNLNLDQSIFLLIWTTTPWTIPLGMATILHPLAEYVLAKVQDKYVILGADLTAALSAKIGQEFTVVAKFNGQEVLKDLQAHHPINPGQVVPLIFDNMVATTDGTAIVHCAPGCGPEDYFVARANNLEIYSPITSEGKYDKNIKIPELVAMPVADGQFWVIKKLAEVDRLLFKENYLHSYPHCWRCGNGLIFRATKQWFCDLTKNNLQEETLVATEKINFVPAWGKQRFQSFIGSRKEWCISRQRIWGAPIVALKCLDCDQAIINKKMISAVAEQIKKTGIEYWDTVSIDELKKIGAIDSDLKCSCGSQSFKKETDILDVWFDSGMVHSTVYKNDSEDFYPMDLYLEGSDQHRGWFQSSILTSMMLNNKPCVKTILTHGFVLDQDRLKMSKSKGNGMLPTEVQEEFGSDVLRLWAASTDFENDVAISKDILKSTSQIHKKIRNTCRFLLLNLFDFDVLKNIELPVASRFDWKTCDVIDRYILGELSQLLQEVDQAYQEFNFTDIVQKFNNFCINQLSAGYLDMVKDRLYADKADSIKRRATQQVLLVILENLIDRIAPICSFMAEELYQFLVQDKTKTIFSLTQQSPELIKQIIDEWDKHHNFADLSQTLELLKDVALECYKKVEVQREAAAVKQFSDADLEIFVDLQAPQGAAVKNIFDLTKQAENPQSFARAWLKVSQVEFVSSPENLEATKLSWLSVKVKPSQGVRCPRCWFYNQDNLSHDLCLRCKNIVD